MSFLFGNSQALPQPDQKLMGLNATRAATNEQARPVPLLYGRQRLGITFLSQAFDVEPVEISQDTGKKAAPSGHDYFCSFAALICHGLVDHVEAVYFDDEKVWPEEGDGVVARDEGQDFVGLSVGRGNWSFYWGTETQEINESLARLAPPDDEGGDDDEAEPNSNPEERHSAYRGQCYFVASRHFIGYNRTNVQNIEVVVCRWPVIAWIPTPPKIDGDCNAAHVIAELLTNTRYGLGLRDASADDTRLDRASFIATAAQLDAEFFGLSPLLTRGQPVRDVLRTILEYIDGFITSNAAGQLVLGLVRPLDCGVMLPTIDEVALVQPPQLSIAGWETTANDVRLVFSNRAEHWKEDAATANDLANLQITGEPATQTLSRPWITSPGLADRLARVAALGLAMPKTSGRLTIRKSWLRGLRPGDVFKFNYSHYNLCWLYCRVTEVATRDGRQPEVDLAFEVDRAFLGRSLVSPPAYVPPVKPVRVPAPVTAALLLETPYNRSSEKKPYISFLVARPTPLTSRVKLLRRRSVDSFPAIGEISQFVWRGILAGDHDATDTGTLRIEFDKGINLGDVLATSDEQALDKWLLVIRVADAPRVFTATECEFVSIRTPEFVSAVDDKRTYDFANPLRGRKDTVPLDLPDGAEVWLVNESILANTARWPSGAASPGEESFKLQPVVFGKELALENCGAPWTITLVGRAGMPWTPHNLTANYTDAGIILNWTPGALYPPPESMAINRWWVQLRAVGDDDEYPPADYGPSLSYSHNAHTATLTNSQIAAVLGGTPDSLILRLYARTALDEFSLNYVELELTKS